MSSIITSATDKAQDIQSLYTLSKYAVLGGTGFLIAKNWRVGIPFAMRLSWIVAKSQLNMGYEVGKLIVNTARGTQSQGKASAKKPPTPVRGRHISSRPIQRPPGGGVLAYAVWAGVVYSTLINANSAYADYTNTDPLTRERLDPITGGPPIA